MTMVRLWKGLKALGGGSRRLPCGSTGFCWFVEIGATSGSVDMWLLSGPQVSLMEMMNHMAAEAQSIVLWREPD